MEIKYLLRQGGKIVNPEKVAETMNSLTDAEMTATLEYMVRVMPN